MVAILEVGGREVAEGGLAASAVTESLNVLENGGPGRRQCRSGERRRLKCTTGSLVSMAIPTRPQSGSIVNLCGFEGHARVPGRHRPEGDELCGRSHTDL
jgi:hypothetical protein